jgi:hypothetical protein
LIRGAEALSNPESWTGKDGAPGCGGSINIGDSSESNKISRFAPFGLRSGLRQSGMAFGPAFFGTPEGVPFSCGKSSGGALPPCVDPQMVPSRCGKSSDGALPLWWLGKENWQRRVQADESGGWLG